MKIDLFTNKYESFYTLDELDNNCKLHVKASKTELIDGYCVALEIIDNNKKRIPLEDYFFYRDGNMSVLKGF